MYNSNSFIFHPIDEIFEFLHVQICMENFVLGLSNQQAISMLAVFAENLLGFLLELLGADLVGTYPTWNNHRTARNFSESLGEELAVKQISLQHSVALIVLEHWINLLGVNLLTRFE